MNTRFHPEATDELKEAVARFDHEVPWAWDQKSVAVSQSTWSALSCLSAYPTSRRTSRRTSRVNRSIVAQHCACVSAPNLQMKIASVNPSAA